MASKLIVPREKYLAAGMHIGMTSRTADMRRFIYKVRPNGLAVINIGKLDRRLGFAAAFLADKKKILVVARKENARDPAKKFAEVIGGKAITERFMPGTLTNPSYREFFEPDVMISTDPNTDRQAIKEGVQMRMPIIGLADTYNETSYVDLVLPCNNKGKKSLALLFWILAKLIKEKKGEKFELTPEDFGYM